MSSRESRAEILKILSVNFGSRDFTNINDIESSVSEYMREISRDFLELQVQDKINSSELDIADKNLKAINKQKKSNKYIW